jgi:hypothetical protein
MIDVAGKDTPEHWRLRAQEARADADRQVDPDIKKALLEIAALYECLAVSPHKSGII